ncbi:MAG TPA: ABC transporter permease [Flavobacterium sp.]|uniref:ABC transporter permease n=1 Tax=unclassified Flavobacterium TaxID=196869 RepID=UPI000E989175|nr:MULTISPECIES: ABC transporter permease [unclassified Flavobacterium]HBI00461.1 ABC transporter permease [Flavobacterium sp.]HRE78557.1 ABC transporter permease [Flavobacterium sp.]
MQPLENLIEIQNYLPHRAPMLMVDYIVEFNEDEVVTVFEIKNDNLFVENSFFSEIGLIENAAQTCSSIVAKSYFIDDNHNEKEDVSVVGFISGIKKLQVDSLPQVGNTIQTKASLISRFDADEYKICSMKCTTYFETELLFEAELNLYIQKTN